MAWTRGRLLLAGVGVFAVAWVGATWAETAEEGTTTPAVQASPAPVPSPSPTSDEFTDADREYMAAGKAAAQSVAEQMRISGPAMKDLAAGRISRTEALRVLDRVHRALADQERGLDTLEPPDDHSLARAHLLQVSALRDYRRSLEAARSCVAELDLEHCERASELLGDGTQAMREATRALNEAR